MAQRKVRQGEPQGKANAGAKNLRHDFTPEERAANGRKGGINSGIARREAKSFREAVQGILDCLLPEDQREELEAMGVEPTYRNQIVLAAVKKSMEGNITAVAFVRDTGGEKPKDGSEPGYPEDKPLSWLDMSGLTDEQLRAIAARKAAGTEEEAAAAETRAE